MDTDEECSIVLELPKNDPFFDKKKVEIKLFCSFNVAELFTFCFLIFMYSFVYRSSLFSQNGWKLVW